MKELDEVAGITFVDGCEQQAAFARKIFVLLLLRPRRIGRRNVIDRREPLLVRTRNIYVRKVPSLVWRRDLYLTLLGSRDRNNIFLLDELPQTRKLCRRGLNQILARSLTQVCFLVAV